MAMAGEVQQIVKSAREREETVVKFGGEGEREGEGGREWEGGSGREGGREGGREREGGGGGGVKEETWWPDGRCVKVSVSGVT